MDSTVKSFKTLDAAYFFFYNSCFQIDLSIFLVIKMHRQCTDVLILICLGLPVL
jgi:hypothetical protein